MAADSAGAGGAATALLLVACFDVLLVEVVAGAVPPVLELVMLAATLDALAAREDVVTVAPIVGGRLEARIGDGSICCTKLDGKTPTLLRRRPRHQPSST